MKRSHFHASSCISLYTILSRSMVSLSCRSAIRDKIIPHAVSWFTGEAAQGDDFEDLEDDDDGEDEEDEDDEDEEEDEEDEDDDDDDEDEGKIRKKVYL